MLGLRSLHLKKVILLNGQLFFCVYVVVLEEHFLDEETATWPVHEDHLEALHKLMYDYRVLPLPVFKDNKFVEPIDVKHAMKDALVEVHFGILHYRIGSEGNNPHDSYSAIPRQIIVLKDGTPPPVSPYKRKNVREGPYRPKAFDEPATVAGTGQPKPNARASGSGSKF